MPQYEASGDGFRLGGIPFKVIVGGDYSRMSTDEDGVVLLKDWEFVERQLRELEGVDISRMLEVGIWQGGSAVLWPLIVPLEKYVGIDRKTDEIRFPRAVREHERFAAVSLYGGVSQDDRERLTEILDQEFDDPLDLIIDDASHQYRFSKATFNITFPRLRPGGVYVLEDWAWAHWGGKFQEPDHPWAGYPALTNLVFELVMAAASRQDVIARIKIVPGMVLLWRGEAELGHDFDLDHIIVCRGKRLQLI
jgi:SAM-dependent methyltransferase